MKPALEITFTETQDGYTYKRTEFANGVRPKEANSALRIWTSLMERIGPTSHQKLRAVHAHV